MYGLLNVVIFVVEDYLTLYSEPLYIHTMLPSKSNLKIHHKPKIRAILLNLRKRKVDPFTITTSYAIAFIYYQMNRKTRRAPLQYSHEHHYTSMKNSTTKSKVSWKSTTSAFTECRFAMDLLINQQKLLITSAAIIIYKHEMTLCLQSRFYQDAVRLAYALDLL